MLQDGTLTISDPVYEESERLTLLGRIFIPLIRNERDLAFVRLALFLSVIFPPLGISILCWRPLMAALAVPTAWQTPIFWGVALVYWACYLWWVGPFILMLHNTSHRPLFKRKYEILNKYIPWCLGTWLGVSPGTYYAHHIGMHHREGNLPKDLSSTMQYQRDSFRHFLHYYFSFMTCYFRQTRYFLGTRSKKMLKRFWVGEGFFLLLCASTLYVDWLASLLLFTGPLFVTRLALMSGNWGQHAFVDPDEPFNDYRSVISFINSAYNHRCFNDGYHLGHHLTAGRHWLDMPADFIKRKPEMIRQDSLVFERLDYFVIFLLLMFKRYKKLASYVVQLDPENLKSEEEIIALFHRRLKRFSPEQLAHFAQRPT